MHIDWTHIEWITLLRAAGLIALSALWIVAKFELRSVRGEVSAIRGALENNVRELSESVDRLRTDREAEPVPAPASAVAAAGLNLTKRAQIVRMHRRGEMVHSIAAALQTPRNEIELILKMERLLNSGGAASA